ncbi:hypothetical protein E2H86_15820 [Pseudomonas putida]|uniref:hypothetical protein n=1 Tax=Pseudomonas TaxID=286 RepID=UPI00105A7075|nr:MULTISPECIES: hypothetical protein [Pseudomonas]MBF8745370.1 hypothetical protein [Pseudomonas monteilii]MCT8166452.1 hypothetical protein [Pseudomonas sp. HD6422]MCT8185297.1 hypothetical protein [Pseudomonas sp. HD6421]TDJ75961.1 hypothetical protein E2H86_15820 [Pseudomonas putida]
MWIGSDQARFRLQRRIMGVALFFAVFFLAAKIEAYLVGDGTLTDVLRGLFVTGFTGGAFYLAGRW